MDNVPELVKNVEDSEAKIDWGKLSKDDVLKYCFNSEDMPCIPAYECHLLH